MTKSPRLFLTIIACAGMMTAASVSYADVNEKMKESKYCESNPGDPVCMGPESLKMRTSIMEMTKDKAMESRTKFCTDNASGKDPICDEAMKNDSTGFSN